VELYLHSPNTPSWRGAWLKHRYIYLYTCAYVCVCGCDLKDLVTEMHVVSTNVPVYRLKEPIKRDTKNIILNHYTSKFCFKKKSDI
jgi:hypothetical protein